MYTYISRENKDVQKGRDKTKQNEKEIQNINHRKTLFQLLEESFITFLNMSFAKIS